MPELPEVETIRRQLEPDLVGRRIASVEVIDQRWTRLSGEDVEAVCAGRKIESVGRRGKFLLIGLEGGWTLIRPGAFASPQTGTSGTCGP
jgi:formamidopyrimidine-DNA glycosylase